MFEGNKNWTRRKEKRHLYYKREKKWIREKKEGWSSESTIFYTEGAVVLCHYNRWVVSYDQAWGAVWIQSGSKTGHHQGTQHNTHLYNNTGSTPLSLSSSSCFPKSLFHFTPRTFIIIITLHVYLYQCCFHNTSIDTHAWWPLYKDLRFQSKKGK